MPIDQKTKTELEAAAFRRLVEHLRSRTDVQNIDMMNLAGFCRNCLSNWMKEAADAKGVATRESSGKVLNVLDVYRRILAAQPDGKVTMIAVGQMNNLVDLLNAPPTGAAHKFPFGRAGQAGPHTHRMRPSHTQNGIQQATPDTAARYARSRAREGRI